MLLFALAILHASHRAVLSLRAVAVRSSGSRCPRPLPGFVLALKWMAEHVGTHSVVDLVRLHAGYDDVGF